MGFSKKFAEQAEVDMADSYTYKAESIRRGLKQESIAFRACLSSFLEYVRPQQLPTSGIVYQTVSRHRSGCYEIGISATNRT